MRSGFVDKEIEAEEAILLEEAMESSNKHSHELKNYDDLDVEVINKFNLELPEPQEEFEDMQFAEPLKKNIDNCGYKRMSIIQKYAVPIMKNKFNIMASSQTGSGKTAAFLLPVIQDMIANGPPKNDISKDDYKKCKRIFEGVSTRERDRGGVH